MRRRRRSRLLPEAGVQNVMMSGGAERRAVFVSPELFDRAIEALEDQRDLAAAREAEGDLVSHAEVLRELGL